VFRLNKRKHADKFSVLHDHT